MALKGSDEPQVTVRLPPRLYRGLKRYADKRGVGLIEAIERVVRDAVAAELDGDDRRQVRAEAELLDYVDRVVGGLRDAGGWDEHVTGLVFDRIRDEALDTYAAAVGREGDPFAFGNPEKARVNKRIGTRVRHLLGAEVMLTPGGDRAKGQPSRTGKSLVMSYTLLRPAR